MKDIYYKCKNFDWWGNEHFKVGDDPLDENFVLLIEDGSNYWVKLVGDKTFRRVRTAGGGMYDSRGPSTYELAWATDKEDSGKIGRFFRDGDKLFFEHNTFKFDFFEPTDEYDISKCPKIDFPQDVYYPVRLLEYNDGSGFLVIYDKAYYTSLDPDDLTGCGAVKVDPLCEKVLKRYKTKRYTVIKDGGTLEILLEDSAGTGEKLELTSPNRIGGGEENNVATIDEEVVFSRIRDCSERFYSLLSMIGKLLNFKFYKYEENQGKDL